ncbi:glycine/D-amino acid oxidase-like deaminating enzyme [Sphingomonas sp. PP-CE-3A-406]|uniref:NAD(P)/FAD-dependent oxidoreductase n=1 Tax=Sphingomonas sp. PP-CE-3A-406 TaxID=2135659 RepID=UPI000EF99A79|nr:FAD-dependent oxidoreductase [Sphingomonas sp. PP-CE-3A-406]RMB54592.1 glycine/D-amino acid oxidase-like deaminating enzyme [Sphingomonas sp. PP-CE-3A-406]
MKTIGIVGGGVVGLSCAVALLDRGYGVSVFERDADYNAASWGNAGHIAVEQVEPLASPAAVRSVPKRLFSVGGALGLPVSMAAHWLPFAARLVAASTPAKFAAGTAALTPLLAGAMTAWRDLVGTLGARDLLREDGHIVVWDTPETARAGRTHWSRAAIGTARIADADPDVLHRLGFLADPVGGAIRFTGSGQIADLRVLATTLEAAVEARGGRIVRQAARLADDSGRIVIIGHDVDQLLVTAGVRSRALLEPLGYRVPMIAERGYHIRARADGWPADLPPVVFEDRSMIVTRYADCVQAASFVELGDPDGAPDPRKWDRLEHHVRSLGLPIEGPFTRWMGARPTLPDYLPAIGRSTRHANLAYAFGHQHLGLTLAPVTATLVAAMLAGETPAVPLAPFDLDRFGKKGPDA